MAASPSDESRLALFIDFENIAIGVRDAHYRKFDIDLLLERLLDKGKLLVKRAYADWSRYSDYKRAFHEAAVELIEVPQKSVGGKNSADIRLVVDAMDMSFQKEHINCFVVASGDSDFSPLVSKLKENNKYVIGMGVKNSTSDLLLENCDEFIFYEDLVRGQSRPMPQIANVPEKLHECFGLLVDSVLALQRENKEILWGSMVKETMKRKKPSFNETYYGYRSFSQLLEDAQRRGVVTLRRDQRSGSYIIEDLRDAAVAETARDATPATASNASAATAEAKDAASGSESSSNGRGRRRRSRGGRGRSRSGAAASTGETTTDTTASSDESGASDDASDETGFDSDGQDYDDAPDRSAQDEHDAHDDAPRDEAPDTTPDSPATAPPDDAEPRATERSFSLFSWMRRDPDSEDDEGKD